MTLYWHQIRLLKLGLLVCAVGWLLSISLLCATTTDSEIETVFDEVSLDIKPIPINAEKPLYPPKLKAKDVEGFVTVDYIVGADGFPHSIQIVAYNDAEFSNAVLAAMTKWQFKPGQRQGHSVNSRIRQDLDFTLDGKVPKKPFLITAVRPKNKLDVPNKTGEDELPPLVNISDQIVYPFDALRRGQAGGAIVQYYVIGGGKAQDVKIESASAPEFGLAAVAAIESVYFSEAEPSSHHDSVSFSVPKYNFKPDGSGLVRVSESAKRILKDLIDYPERILSPQGLDTSLKLIHPVSPVHPSSFANDKKPGDALIEFFIDDDGYVQLPRVVSSTTPEFGAAAVQAVAFWRFAPPKKNGIPVIIRTQVPIKFK